MYGIIVFLSYVASLSVVGAGFLYCYDKEKFDELSNKVTWNTVKYYHKANIEMRKFLEDDDKSKKINKKTDESSSNNDETECYFFIGCNINENSTFQCDLKDLKKKKYYIDQTEFDIMFVKKVSKLNMDLWKRVLHKDELNNLDTIKVFNDVSKPFLQVEYCISENKESPQEKIEIHNKLQNFYIENNMILDKKFIQWFVKTYFNENTSEDYTLQIIDSQISIFNLSNKDFCIINDKGYEIKQN